jgi:hypothetical protein
VVDELVELDTPLVFDVDHELIFAWSSDTVDTMSNCESEYDEPPYREIPEQYDALWVPDVTHEEIEFALAQQAELKTRSMSPLAEAILEDQWILCTPLEAIQYAIDSHIDSILENGHSIYRDQNENPIDHATFVAALSEIVSFFVFQESQKFVR